MACRRIGDNRTWTNDDHIHWRIYALPDLNVYPTTFEHRMSDIGYSPLPLQ